MTLEQFGHLVRSRRLAKQLTIDEVARRAGIPRDELAELEAGRLRLKPIDEPRVCRVLGITVKILDDIDGLPSTPAT